MRILSSILAIGALIALLALPAASAAVCIHMGEGVPGTGHIYMGEYSRALVEGGLFGKLCGNTAALAVAERDSRLTFGCGVKLKAEHVSMNITVEESLDPLFPPEEKIDEVKRTEFHSGVSFEMFCEKDSRILFYGEQMCSLYFKAGNDRDSALSFCSAGTEIYPMEPEGYDLETIRLPGYWYVGQPTVPCSLWSPLLNFSGDYRMFILGPDVKVPELDETFFTGIWQTREKGYWYDETTDSWIGPGYHDEIHIEYIEITISESVFELPMDGFNVDIYYDEESSYWVDGTLKISDATGDLTVGDDYYDFDNEELEISGHFLLQPESGEEGAEFYCSNEFTRIKTSSFSKDYTTAALALALAGGVSAAAWMCRGPLTSLWSRITNDGVLLAKTRRRIYLIIKENQGIGQKTLAEMSGLGWGNVCYHLSVLQKEDYVALVNKNGRKGYFTNEKEITGKRNLLLARRNEKDRALLLALENKKGEGMTETELISLTGITQSTASYHLVRLVEEGILRKEADGRYAKFYLV